MSKNASEIQTKIVIRKAEEDDLPFFEKLYIETRRDEFAILDWDDNQIEMLLKMQFNAQTQSYRMQFPDMENFVIEADGNAVGRLMTNGEIRLIDIAVLPESRNLGIGSFVLNHLLEQANGKQKHIFLQVLKTNVAAFRLYERFGFQTIGEDDLYLLMRRNSSATN